MVSPDTSMPASTAESFVTKQQVGFSAAREYIKAGFKVFPCKHDKKPLVAWKDAATASLDAVAAWEKTFPDAMIGLPTGSANGIVVVDVDVKDSVDGHESLHAAGFDIPDGTVCVQTPSGGAHYYFRLEPGEVIKNSTSQIAKNVDVRGEGGYVIAPPSVLGPGKQYQFAMGFNIDDVKGLVQ